MTKTDVTHDTTERGRDEESNALATDANTNTSEASEPPTTRVSDGATRTPGLFVSTPSASHPDMPTGVFEVDIGTVGRDPALDSADDAAGETRPACGETVIGTASGLWQRVAGSAAFRGALVERVGELVDGLHHSAWADRLREHGVTALDGAFAEALSRMGYTSAAAHPGREPTRFWSALRLTEQFGSAQPAAVGWHAPLSQLSEGPLAVFATADTGAGTDGARSPGDRRVARGCVRVRLPSSFFELKVGQRRSICDVLAMLAEVFEVRVEATGLVHRRLALEHHDRLPGVSVRDVTGRLRGGVVSGAERAAVESALGADGLDPDGRAVAVLYELREAAADVRTYHGLYASDVGVGVEESRVRQCVSTLLQADLVSTFRRSAPDRPAGFETCVELLPAGRAAVDVIEETYGRQATFGGENASAAGSRGGEGGVSERGQPSHDSRLSRAHASARDAPPEAPGGGRVAGGAGADAPADAPPQDADRPPAAPQPQDAPAPTAEAPAEATAPTADVAEAADAGVDVGAEAVATDGAVGGSGASWRAEGYVSTGALPRWRADAIVGCAPDGGFGIVDQDIEALDDPRTPGWFYDREANGGRGRLIVSAEYRNPMQWWVCIARALVSTRTFGHVLTEERLEAEAEELDFEDEQRVAFIEWFREHRNVLRNARCLGYMPDRLEEPSEYVEQLSEAEDHLCELTRRYRRGEFDCAKNVYRSVIIREALGLAGTVVHLLDMVGVDVVREARVPRFNRMDLKARSDMAKTLAVGGAIQSRYREFAAYRQQFEARPRLRKSAIEPVVDSSQPFGRLIGSFTIVGPGISRSRQDDPDQVIGPVPADEADDVEESFARLRDEYAPAFVRRLRDSLGSARVRQAEAPDFEIDIPIQYGGRAPDVDDTSPYPTPAAAAGYDADAADHRAYARAAVATLSHKNLRLTRPACRVLRAIAASPYAVSRALDRLAPEPVDSEGAGRRVRLDEVRFALGQLPPGEVLPDVRDGDALGEALVALLDPPEQRALTAAELADWAACSKRSLRRVLPVLETLGLVRCEALGEVLDPGCDREGRTLRWRVRLPFASSETDALDHPTRVKPALWESLRGSPTSASYLVRWLSGDLAARGASPSLTEEMREIPGLTDPGSPPEIEPAYRESAGPWLAWFNRRVREVYESDGERARAMVRVIRALAGTTASRPGADMAAVDGREGAFSPEDAASPQPQPDRPLTAMEAGETGAIAVIGDQPSASVDADTADAADAADADGEPGVSA